MTSFVANKNNFLMIVSELLRRITSFKTTETTSVKLKTFTESIETTGSLSKYALCLGFETPDRFIYFLEGKKILDASSGYDGLAIEIILNGINCNLIANNPGRRNPHFRQDRLRNVLDHEDFQQYHRDLIERATRLIDKTATSYFSQALLFASGSFDAVIDVNGIFYYAQPEEAAELYKSAIHMYRVTRSHGHILVGDRFFFLDKGRDPLWKKELIEQLDIPYCLLSPDRYGQPYGILITKE